MHHNTLPWLPRIMRLGAALALTVCAVSAHAQKVEFKTSQGNFTLELDAKAAPKTVENFMQYVKAKHYDGTVFHRVIPGFMVQGGGMDKDMKEKPTKAPIALESANGLKNTRGTVAMARTSDPNSATAQFFVNVVDNEFLNHYDCKEPCTINTPRGPVQRPAGFKNDGYAVFGKVTAGMDVLDKIIAVPTGNNGPHQNVPTTPVTITSARIVK
jgi:peptidyl-prolyl cis-trans isomerase A (cyclophilin A)